MHEVGHLCVTDTRKVVIRGTKWCELERDTKRIIQVWSPEGILEAEWPAKCKHPLQHVQLTTWMANNTEHITETCWVCGAVYVYDLTSNKDISLFARDGIWPKAISTTQDSGSTVLCVSDRHNHDNSEILLMKWDKETNQLQQEGSVPIESDIGSTVSCMSCVGQTPYIVLTHGSRNLITCIHIPSGDIKWNLGGSNEMVAGKVLDPRDICCDSSGLIYVIDRKNERILQISAEFGRVTGVLDSISDIKFCHIAWNTKDDELIVCTPGDLTAYTVSHIHSWTRTARLTHGHRKLRLTHDFEILRLTPDFETLRLAGVRRNVLKSHVRCNISKSGVRRNISKSSARRNIL